VIDHVQGEHVVTLRPQLTSIAGSSRPLAISDQHAPVDQFLQRATFGDDPYASFNERATKAGLPEIQVSAVFGRLLETFVKLVGASTVVEVGTLGGYSAAWLARSLREPGRLVTLEIDPHHAAVARENLDGAGLGSAVDIRIGPAAEALAVMTRDATLAGRVDLAFIDADKSNNPRYVGFAVDLVRPGGLIIVDNVVRGGRVLEQNSEDPNILGTRGALELLGSFPQLTATALQTVGVKGWDGFAVAFVNP
jgi:predicted O-methyltransferase YrrM